MLSIQFSYENRNQSSYLLATCPAAEKIVQYQLQMMVANEIPGLLPTMKLQKDDNILIYYNITSRVSLSQILSRRKLSKKEFLNLLSGATGTWRELQDYQLESDGLYLQEDYIFVKSDTCTPAFVFLPLYVSSNGMEGLREFIQRLILKGAVETSSDNFIQVLLNTLNDEETDIDRLEKCIQNLSGKRKKTVQAKVSAAEIPSPAPVSSPTPVLSPTPVPMPKTVPEPEPSSQPEEPSFDMRKAKQKFLLVQAVFMVAVAAMVSFGAFVDKATGGIAVKNILAVVLIVAALEFVIYREIFVYGKKKKGGKPKGKEKREKKEKKPRRDVVIPGSENEKPLKESPRPAPDPVPTPMPIPVPVPIQPESEGAASDDDTSYWDKESAICWYLEYLDNGSSRKIGFKGCSLLIGRLASQVDFAVSNPRVGKMHAEFVLQDGGCYVRDLNSKNGTYINKSEERISSNVLYPLSDGDRVALADSEFVIHGR